MTVENNQPVDEQTPPAAPATPPSADDSKVTISKEDYQELLGAVSMLQLIAQQNQQQQKPQEPQHQLTPEDVDRMSNRQLLQLVQEQTIQPLLSELMTMKVREEIRECKAEFNDFNDYKKEVHALASANTSLSLRDAYLLAKANKKPATPAPQSVTPSPSATPPAPTPGHKPGPAPTNVQASSQMSVRQAAEKALEQLKYTE